MADTPPPQPSSNHLPIILCLHGSGVSPPIFTIQLRTLTSLLHHHFQFLHLRAPFPSPPGPGIHPIFSSAGPFYTWVATPRGIGLDEEVRREEEESLRFVEGFIWEREREREEMGVGRGTGMGGEIVGILGFSMGARIAAGVLLRQQSQPPHSPPSRLFPFQPHPHLSHRLKFGIFICGTYPPILGEKTAQEVRKIGRRKGIEWEEKINVPIIHVLGTRDPYATQSRKLLKGVCRSEKSEVVEFEGGHQCPTGLEDGRRVVEGILRVWEGV